MKRSILLPAALFSALLATSQAPATASPANDPRIAINALNTPGDLVSLFRINEPGSYYLERNETGVPGKNGIVIGAPDVHIDLMGFRLAGVPDGLSAIAGWGAHSAANLSVRNGTITDWPLYGIELISSSHVEVRDIATRNITLDAIRVGPHSVVERCRVLETQSTGILAASHSLVVDCSVAQADGPGISVNLASIVRGCRVNSVSSTGITALAGSVVSSCTVWNAGVEGIKVTTGTIEGCSVRDSLGNGITIDGGTVRDCEVVGNVGHGIEVGSSTALVVGNRISSNALDGVHCGSGARIEQNHIRSHLSGHGIRVLGSACFVARNTLFGNVAALSVHSAGNFIGPLVHVNSVHGRDNPWANIHG